MTLKIKRREGGTQLEYFFFFKHLIMAETFEFLNWRTREKKKRDG